MPPKVSKPRLKRSRSNVGRTQLTLATRRKLARTLTKADLVKLAGVAGISDIAASSATKDVIVDKLSRSAKIAKLVRDHGVKSLALLATLGVFGAITYSEHRRRAQADVSKIEQFWNRSQWEEGVGILMSQHPSWTRQEAEDHLEALGFVHASL